MRAIQIAATVILTLLVAFPAFAEDAPPRAQNSDNAADKIDAEKLFGAIVKVSTRSVPGARSAASLGDEREGTGVVIGDQGLVLTIGYLIVEADEVKVTDAKGRTFPAQVVGYDHASGFGLVRAVAPLDAKPIPLGDSAKLNERDPVMIASGRRRGRGLRMDRLQAPNSPATGNTSSTTRSTRVRRHQLERCGADRSRWQARSVSAR